MRIIFPKAKGLARANAQGHAMINTAVKTLSALALSYINQNIVETKAIPRIEMVKYLLVISIRVTY